MGGCRSGAHNSPARGSSGWGRQSRSGRRRLHAGTVTDMGGLWHRSQRAHVAALQAAPSATLCEAAAVPSSSAGCPACVWPLGATAAPSAWWTPRWGVWSVAWQGHNAMASAAHNRQGSKANSNHSRYRRMPPNGTRMRPTVYVPHRIGGWPTSSLVTSRGGYAASALAALSAPVCQCGQGAGSGRVCPGPERRTPRRATADAPGRSSRWPRRRWLRPRRCRYTPSRH
ncbi:hypothetical protein Tchar_01835 [Tepidimonas charontis]|uniref:Uncharacterized protein n=1 Tax=Tepidimonas charontis TaxID=2267262 RepID=A0A554XBS8_9BURK|nr:hypothetical protein Tchar_01835 [Tepidimonas charontis]